MLGLVSALLVMTPSLAQAQDSADTRRIKITGDRLSGFVLPIEPVEGDIELQARNANAWTIDDTKRLFLEGDVLVSIGAYQFHAQKAVVWINRMPSEGGTITQIAIHFDKVDAPRQPSGLAVAGKNLLITGSAKGDVNLSAWSIKQSRPRGRVFLQASEERLATHLKQLLSESQTLAIRPQVERPAPKPEDSFVPVPGGQVLPQDIELPKTIEMPTLEDITPWLRDPEGTISYMAQKFTYIPGDEEDIITLTGSFVIEYIARRRANDFSQITLSAQRAVIFTDPGLTKGIGSARLSTENIRGIYLEGNVHASADDGDYVARAPQMYYDFTSGQAIMLEAILRTYMRDIRMPIYARAEEMRQIAAGQWEAKNVVASTSEFFTPHLAIGAKRMTITRRPTFADPTEKETYLKSADNTLQAGGMPFFYWPEFKGTIRDIPLKRLTFGTRSNDGFTVKTEWDLPSLLGTDAIDGLDLRVKLDYFEKRGTGFGLGAEYDFDNSIGEFDLYAIQDRGEDKTTSGKDIDQDGDWRGVALWEHTSNLPNGWKLQFQASYISDETYIDAWRPDDFESRRQYETSFYLQQITANRAISIYTSYDINDFISNDYLLASKGYTVDKLPETRFASYGNSWFDGKVTYSNEFRMSRMKFNFETHSENELGIRNGAYPTIGPNVPISDYHRARGLSSQYISRFDTRHEIAIPLKYDNLNFTPFLVGRFTAYSDDFEDFSGEDDDSRAFGAVGMRFSAQYQHVDNAVESSMFDLHRLRHIIEPNVTVWFGTSNVDQEDLPVYDTEVESLGTGTVVRAGLRNVWQTQRGGPGRWRSVDVLTLDAGVVYNSNDADRESPTPQFFDYRPEYSQFGDHGYGSFALMLSDSLSFTGTGIYDIEESLLARGSIGTELRHSPLLTSYVEYRYIEAGTSKLLGVGFNYLITPKYKIAISPQWDLEEDDLRSISARLQRAFPDFTLTTRIRYDDIRDETTVSASIDLIEF